MDHSVKLYALCDRRPSNFQYLHFAAPSPLVKIDNQQETWTLCPEPGGRMNTTESEFPNYSSSYESSRPLLNSLNQNHHPASLTTNALSDENSFRSANLIQNLSLKFSQNNIYGKQYLRRVSGYSNHMNTHILGTVIKANFLFWTLPVQQTRVSVLVILYLPHQTPKEHPFMKRPN